MKECKVTTFNVGQGLFNLMTGIKDNGSKYSAVFDCGNLSQCNTKNCTADAAKTLTDGGYKHLDLVVISHQDEDHWRNFVELIQQLNPNLTSWIKKDDNQMFKISVNDIHTFKMIPTDNFIKYTSSIHMPKSSLTGEALMRTEIYINKIGFKGLNINFVIESYTFQFEKIYVANSDIYRIEIYVKTLSDYFSSSKYSSEEDPIIAFKEFLYSFKGHINTVTLDKIADLLTLASVKIANIKIDDLIEQFKASCPMKFGISQLYLGGDDCEFSYKQFKIVCSIFAETVFELDTMILFSDGYSAKRYNVILERMISYPPIKKTGSVYKNATSVITLFKVKGERRMLFPGDATVHTFNSLRNNNIMLFSKIELFLAPHHGSYDTNFAFEQTGQGNELQLAVNQPLENFIKEYPPSIVHVSAEYSIFGHPSKEFMKTVSKYCTKIYNTEQNNNLEYIFSPVSSSTADNSLKKACIPTVRVPENDMFIPYDVRM